MAIHIGSDKMKEIYIGGDRIKEVYIGSDLVYSLRSAAFNLISESVSQFRLSALYALRQKTYTPSAGNNGYAFKSVTDNSGFKSVYYDFDIRAYRTLTISGSHYSTGSNGSRSRAGVFIGTMSQINAVRYDHDADHYGCMNIVVENTGGSATTAFSATVDISAITEGATEPIYIAMRTNSYYGSTNRILLDTLTLQ